MKHNLSVSSLDRRSKTNPDQASLLNQSGSGKALSRKTSSVRIACKVLNEMKEDEQGKLQMKFNEIKVVLAANSLAHVLDKFRSLRLHSYFKLIAQAQRITTCIKAKPKAIGQKQVQFKDLRQHRIGSRILKNFIQNRIQNVFSQIRRQKGKDFSKLNTLEALFRRRRLAAFNLVKRFSKFSKGLKIVSHVFQSKQQRLLFGALFRINSSHHANAQRVSLLQQSFDFVGMNESQMVEQEEELYDDDYEGMSLKEQLAIKFASTTILITTMNTRILKNYYSFFIALGGPSPNKKMVDRGNGRNYPKIESSGPSIQSIKVSETNKKSQINQRKMIPLKQLITPSKLYSPESYTNTITSEMEYERCRQRILAANTLKNILQIKLNEYFTILSIADKGSAQAFEKNMPTITSINSESSVKYFKPKGVGSARIRGGSTSQQKLQAIVKRVFIEDNISLRSRDSEQNGKGINQSIYIKSTDITTNNQLNPAQQQQNSDQKLATVPTSIKDSDTTVKKPQLNSSREKFKPDSICFEERLNNRQSLIFDGTKGTTNSKLQNAVKSYYLVNKPLPEHKAEANQPAEKSKGSPCQSQGPISLAVVMLGFLVALFLGLLSFRT